VSGVFGGTGAMGSQEVIPLRKAVVATAGQQ
jgi:hypothetical protein